MQGATWRRVYLERDAQAVLEARASAPSEDLLPIYLQVGPGWGARLLTCGTPVRGAGGARGVPLGARESPACWLPPSCPAKVPAALSALRMPATCHPAPARPIPMACAQMATARRSEALSSADAAALFRSPASSNRSVALANKARRREPGGELGGLLAHARRGRAAASLSVLLGSGQPDTLATVAGNLRWLLLLSPACQHIMLRIRSATKCGTPARPQLPPCCACRAGGGLSTAAQPHRRGRPRGAPLRQGRRLPLGAARLDRLDLRAQRVGGMPPMQGRSRLDAATGAMAQGAFLLSLPGKRNCAPWQKRKVLRCCHCRLHATMRGAGTAGGPGTADSPPLEDPALLRTLPPCSFVHVCDANCTFRELDPTAEGYVCQVSGR